jgi:hypothetical protein
MTNTNDAIAANPNNPKKNMRIRIAVDGGSAESVGTGPDLNSMSRTIVSPRGSAARYLLFLRTKRIDQHFELHTNPFPSGSILPNPDGPSR